MAKPKKIHTVDTGMLDTACAAQDAARIDTCTGSIACADTTTGAAMSTDTDAGTDICTGTGQKKRFGQALQTAKKKEKFIEALAAVGNATQAAEMAGAARASIYEWKAADPAFAEAWNTALDAAADRLEQEAWRRATEGTEEPVHYQGRRVDMVRRYSDTLLIFLLKGARPEKYKDIVQTQQQVNIAIKLPD